jgi:hypothetical protein
MIKRIHIWLGLLNLVILSVFGVAGLTAFFHRLSGPQKRIVTSQRSVPFAAPANTTDRQIAEAVASVLRAGGCFPAGPPRDAAGNLRLNCYSPNGGGLVTVFEKEGRMLVESSRNSVWQYLSSLHAALPRESLTRRYLPYRLWSYYVEFSVWSLSAMCLSGVYLWLSTRPRNGLGWCLFSGGSAAFALLWWLGR